ncbi:hypothetical protein BDY21DRAFT_348968 [Lineolata rhizophorae]|uniref:Uncharacterized protein n=1 Tax=Lineolata rhizophorae TaxID=578093 RepID=A0A6A6NX99_9PEZI|nr:hypothetical protein BDY21DRAFT_348968 [Lineolata rhizophorae]
MPSSCVAKLLLRTELWASAYLYIAQLLSDPATNYPMQPPAWILIPHIQVMAGKGESTHARYGRGGDASAPRRIPDSVYIGFATLYSSLCDVRC